MSLKQEKITNYLKNMKLSYFLKYLGQIRKTVWI
jgi:hypothetical protein